jgi:hypothetical protein
LLLKNKRRHCQQINIFIFGTTQIFAEVFLAERGKVGITLVANSDLLQVSGQLLQVFGLWNEFCFDDVLVIIQTYADS